MTNAGRCRATAGHVRIRREAGEKGGLPGDLGPDVSGRRLVCWFGSLDDDEHRPRQIAAGEPRADESSAGSGILEDEGHIVHEFSHRWFSAGLGGP